MTPDDPGRDAPGIWARSLLALLCLLVLVAVIDQLHAQAPHAAPDLVVPAADDDASEEREVVDCRRRSPSSDPVESAFPGGAAAVPRVTSTEVVACPVRYDGHTVEFLGEVVGDVLQRDGGAWVLMNDDAYALESGPLPSHQDFAGSNSGLSVWLDGPLGSQDLTAGGPGVRGDVLLVEGELHRADPADGGGLTLRATSARVVAEAQRVDQPLHTAQSVAALLAALGAVALVVAERFVARNR